MGNSGQSSLVQPLSQGFGIDAEQGTDVGQRKKIHDVSSPFSRSDRLSGQGRQTDEYPRFLGKFPGVPGNFLVVLANDGEGKSEP